MEWLALAIFVSTVLLLVDKNQKWRSFRRWLIWSSVTVIVLLTVFVVWQERQARRGLENSIRAAQIDNAARNNGGVATH